MGGQVKLGHRFSQIFGFFVAFNILVIHVHRCPQNGNSYTFQLFVYKKTPFPETGNRALLIHETSNSLRFYFYLCFNLFFVAEFN